jgi:trimeric autotransporter adhesin
MPPRVSSAIGDLMSNLFCIPFTCAATCALLVGQGHLQWKAGEAAPGPGPWQTIYSHAWWDPDGSGPRSPVLVVGGSFEIPSVGARNLAWFDPVARDWRAFAAQPNGVVRSVTTLASGDLAISGNFTSIGATAAGFLAIWNGASWVSPQGGCSGIPSNGGVVALVESPNGDLVVGGSFTAAGGTPISGIARWDGSQWHSLGGVSIQTYCIAQRPNGNLIVGGEFPGQVAEWNGVGWSVFPGGLGVYAQVRAIVVMPNGDVIVSGGPYGIARWTGSAWSSLPGAAAFQPHVLLPLANGDLLAEVGTIGGTLIEGIGRWDGVQWTPYAPLLRGMRSLTFFPSGEFCAMGALQSPGIAPAGAIATWDGTAWSALNDGFDGAVEGLLPTPSGEVLAHGKFRAIGSTSFNLLARFTSLGWAALPPPGPAFPFVLPVTASTLDANGEPWIAVGANGLPGPANIFRRTGAVWQGVGTAAASVVALLIDAAGLPVVGSELYQGTGHRPIQRWTGSAWEALGAGLDSPVRALLELGNGDLIAGGDFLFSGATAVSRIARWDGTTWQPLGPGLDGTVRALVQMPNGDIVAAGDFWNDGTLLRPLPLIARWNGVEWLPLGAGCGGSVTASVRVLHLLPNGDLLAGGDFTTAGSRAIRGLARWDGAEWSAVDGDIDGTVLTIARRADGEVWIGGNFARAGGRSNAHVAIARTDQPAAAVERGSACGSPAPLANPIALPWLGSTWRSRCAPVSATAIGVQLLGTTAVQLPLSMLHPSAAPGCELLTSIELAIPRLPMNGAIESTLVVPSTPSLLGVSLFEQILLAEFSGGILTSLLSSNALALTVGAL